MQPPLKHIYIYVLQLLLFFWGGVEDEIKKAKKERPNFAPIGGFVGDYAGI